MNTIDRIPTGGDGDITIAPPNTTPAIDPRFLSIDGDVHLPTFIVAMLRVGQILTAKDPVVREVTAEKISRIMNKHRTMMRYKPREIRENWEYYHCYMEGGGVQIESSEMLKNHRGPLHYHFTFRKLYTAEEIQKMQHPDTQAVNQLTSPANPSAGAANLEAHEPVRATAG